MTHSDVNNLVHIDNLTRWYPGQRIIYHEFDFDLSKGDFCFIVWKSWSGKTSLMKLLTRAVKPGTWNVYIKWDDVARLNDEEVQAMRRRIGVIYQDYKLLSDRSVLENIMLPLQLQENDDLNAKEKALALIKDFDFTSKAHTKVAYLSWWEKQKVAIMRALVWNPQFLIADEPTWNLDQEATTMIADMLIETNKKWHTVLFITHDQHLITYVQSKLAGVRITEIK